MMFEKRGLPVASRVLVLFGLMLVLLPFASLAQSLRGIESFSERDVYLVSSILQSFAAFMLPAFVAGSMSGQRPMRFLCLDKAPSLRNLAGILIVFVISLPLMNQIIAWNAGISFPESMANVEKLFRDWEEMNGKVGEVLLDDPSIFGLLSGILVIGVLTGLSEEMFFRGALQNTLCETRFGKTAALWIAAFVFSVMHFQFFGFVPRLLLGALFGYYLLWTGSLWNSVFAHAVNNSMVVITVWLEKNGLSSLDYEMIGVSENGFPYFAAASALVTISFFVFFSRYFFPRKDVCQND